MPGLVSTEPITSIPTPGEAEIVSQSGRTRVSVFVGLDGSYTVVAVRDGRTVHSFSDNAEQPGPDGKPATVR